MKGWSFQYNQGTDDYSLFFGLLDDEGEAVSTNVDADMRIVNDNGEEVFAATKSITDDDFGYFESNAAGTRYLADIPISRYRNHRRKIFQRNCLFYGTQRNYCPL